MYTIYEHVSPTGKRYIGQTCQQPERRWRNGNGYCRNTYFFRAIQKHGWENFEHNILATCETLKEANRVEAELIRKYKTNDPKYGYNISGGGDGSDHVAASTRELLSKIKKGTFCGKSNPNYGRKHTPEERERMSRVQKEYFKTHPPTQLGRTRSAETRARQSEGRKASAKAQSAIAALNRSKAKKVKCLETGVVYASTHEVERLTGFRQGNIAAAARGDYRQAYGFRWVYL